MAVSTYRLIDVAKIVSFRAGNIKDNIETLENPEPKIKNLIEVINEVIRDIWQVKPMPWMEDTFYYTTTAPYETGTVTVTTGSPNVTGAGTSWSNELFTGNDVRGSAFRVTARDVFSRIGNVSETTTLLLLGNWPAVTEAGVDYKIYNDSFELPSDFADFISIPVTGVGASASSRTLNIKTPGEFDNIRYSRSTVHTEGAPINITIYGYGAQQSNLNWIARLDPLPDSEYGLEIKYKKRPPVLVNNADLIQLPDENINTLYSGAVALWREVTGDGTQQQYQIWRQTALKDYASFDTRSTEPRFGMAPADVSRSTAGIPIG